MYLPVGIFFHKNNIFAALGFNYLGPVDGHNIAAVESILEIAKSYDRPTVVHVVTQKGKGVTEVTGVKLGAHNG